MGRAYIMTNAEATKWGKRHLAEYLEATKNDCTCKFCGLVYEDALGDEKKYQYFTEHEHYCNPSINRQMCGENL
jgi:hypothetical protein